MKPLPLAAALAAAIAAAAFSTPVSAASIAVPQAASDGIVADAPAGYGVKGTAQDLAWLTQSNGDTAQTASNGFPLFGKTRAGGGGRNAGGQARRNQSFEVAPTGGSAPVPEPAAWALLVLGFAGLGHALRGRAETGERIRFT